MSLREITLDQFLGNTGIYISEVSSLSSHENVIAITSQTGKSLLMWAFARNAPTHIHRTEKLSRYGKNQEARDRAVQRAFSDAEAGHVIAIKYDHWRGPCTAVLMRDEGHQHPQA